MISLKQKWEEIQLELDRSGLPDEAIQTIKQAYIRGAQHALKLVFGGEKGEAIPDTITDPTEQFQAMRNNLIKGLKEVVSMMKELGSTEENPRIQ